jgi:repressor LexA
MSEMTERTFILPSMIFVLYHYFLYLLTVHPIQTKSITYVQLTDMAVSLSMKPLSAKQARVLDFIKAHLSQAGYPPTVREIAVKLGLAGPNSAKKFLDILERKGCIKRRAGCSRAIELREASGGRASLMLPVVGTIRAGAPLLAVENSRERIAVDPSFARGEGLFFLRVKGDSMIEAHVMDGDLALIRPQPEVAPGDMAAVLIGDEATLKYFYKEKNAVRLQPANPACKPIVVQKKDAGQIRIIGKVVGVIRKME